jgi:endonuclease/exonuclease/phosphatase family metal-dependent hydrolase
MVCAVASLVALAGLAGSDAARPAQLRVLQLNLCNSGIAGCYTGRSVAQAATVIRATAPDVVTLNEVCENDVAELARALAQVHRGATVATGFQAAFNDYTGQPVGCRNGQRFGNGLLVHVRRPHVTPHQYGGIYPMQFARDEYRAWLCLRPTEEFAACTTHLPDGDATTAVAQCAYLFGTVIPGMRTSADAPTTVIGADLNLGPADAASCHPPGYVQADDHIVQYVLATTDLRIDGVQIIDMRGTTDHPGLLVTFNL